MIELNFCIESVKNITDINHRYNFPFQECFLLWENLPESLNWDEHGQSMWYVWMIIASQKDCSVRRWKVCAPEARTRFLDSVKNDLNGRRYEWRRETLWFAMNRVVRAIGVGLTKYYALIGIKWSLKFDDDEKYFKNVFVL